MESDQVNSAPLFCVRTKDLITDRTLYVNFYASKSVEHPREDITAEKIIRESFLPSPGIEPLIIPLQSSPIFWSKKKSKSGEGSSGNASDRDYVIGVCFNNRFAYRKVLTNMIIRDYAISVALSCIMDKFNDGQTDGGKFIQYLGHKLELDQPNYKIVDKFVERSNEIVTNKIVMVESGKELPLDSLTIGPSIANEKEDEEPVSCDLHLRPALGILTCSVSTATLPKSISFSDDRILIELADGRTLDLTLPIPIDLTAPMKYKFDDRLCLFRAVFSTHEQ